jgi:tight adherence protein C
MLFGVDVVWIGTVLAFIAAGLVIAVIYLALTIRDPMQKRVKALNERREELKAGIMSAGPKSAPSWSAGRKRRTGSRYPQPAQRASGQPDQRSLAKAGPGGHPQQGTGRGGDPCAPGRAHRAGRSGAAVIYWANYFPAWSDFKKFMGFAAAVGLGYKGPDIYLSNLINKRTAAIRKGCPMRSTCW